MQQGLGEPEARVKSKPRGPIRQVRNSALRLVVEVSAFQPILHDVCLQLANTGL